MLHAYTQTWPPVRDPELDAPHNAWSAATQVTAMHHDMLQMLFCLVTMLCCNDLDRLKKMAIKPATSGSTGGAAGAAAAARPRPGRQAAKAATKKFSLDDSDEEEAGWSAASWWMCI